MQSDIRYRIVEHVHVELQEIGLDNRHMKSIMPIGWNECCLKEVCAEAAKDTCSYIDETDPCKA